ncbi:MAG: hypothetical protein P1P69_04925 [Methanosarcinaceae archaeon]|nr:hypothetical protein [Methanosarcinaceae archaeon]MDF1533831.1 hypothetical protein [Methanosarcinaceae archaeon]
MSSTNSSSKINLSSNFNLKNYDYYLILATSFALLLIGIVCVFGVWYTYDLYTTNPDWQSTIQYPEYISMMNLYVYPFILVLLLSLGLCIPKRIVPRTELIKATGIILLLTLIASFIGGIELGMSFILLMSIAVQAVVFVLTIMKSGSLTFEREGHLIQIGSSLLHLGTVLFIFDFASMRDSVYHIPIFWVVTLLIGIGTFMSFYPSEISKLGRKIALH